MLACAEVCVVHDYVHVGTDFDEKLSMRPEIRRRVRTSEAERMSLSTYSHAYGERKTQPLAVTGSICTCILTYNSAIWHPLRKVEKRILNNQHARNIRSAVGGVAHQQMPKCLVLQ